jgi:hypothetical protein
MGHPMTDTTVVALPRVRVKHTSTLQAQRVAHRQPHHENGSPRSGERVFHVKHRLRKFSTAGCQASLHDEYGQVVIRQGCGCFT